jgi:hypothetical protein
MPNVVAGISIDRPCSPNATVAITNSKRFDRTTWWFLLNETISACGISTLTRRFNFIVRRSLWAGFLPRALTERTPFTFGPTPPLISQESDAVFPFVS